MTLRIEIQEQPERKRFWAEVEMGGMIARRKEVWTAAEAGIAGILAAVFAAAAEMDPRFREPELKPEAEPEANPAERRGPPQGVGYSVPGNRMGDPDQRANCTYAGPEVELAMSLADRSEEAVAALGRLGESWTEVDALRAIAEAAGVRVDRRWGEARLRQEIAAAGREKANEPAPTGD